VSGREKTAALGTQRSADHTAIVASSPHPKVASYATDLGRDRKRIRVGERILPRFSAPLPEEWRGAERTKRNRRLFGGGVARFCTSASTSFSADRSPRACPP